MRPGPQQRGAVAEITRAGEDHPDKHASEARPPPSRASSLVLGSKQFRLAATGNFKCVGGQQLDERLAFLGSRARRK